MGNLTKNFSVEEFRCPCGECDGGGMNPAFMTKLQRVRDGLGVQVKVSSGFRCLEHNAKVGGAPDSQHLFGKAADLTIPDAATRYAIVHMAMIVDLRGIGIAKNYVHLDDRIGDAKLWHYYPK